MVARENKRGLTDEQYADMLEMLNGLTPAERKTLADPDFISEDEADGIVSTRRAKQSQRRGIPLDEVFADLGVPRRRPRV